MNPIDQHDRYVRAGRVLTKSAAIVAKLDLPDRLDLPSDRPVLLAGNHRSLFDLVATLVIFAKFDLSSRIMVRADYMRRPPSSWLLHGIGCIPTSSTLRDESEAEAIESLQDGQLVSMMPEGRLVAPSEWVRGVGPGKIGVSRIARAAGAVVVPVGFSGTEKVWPRGRWPKVQRHRPVVTLRLGPAIELTTDDHEANTEQVMAGIADVLVVS